MVSIKRKHVKAYVLLESLIALGILSVVTSLVLGQLITGQNQYKQAIEHQEALTVAAMAVQTHQDHLELNGHAITVQKTEKGVAVYEGNQQLLALTKP